MVYMTVYSTWIAENVVTLNLCKLSDKFNSGLDFEVNDPKSQLNELSFLRIHPLLEMFSLNCHITESGAYMYDNNREIAHQ